MKEKKIADDITNSLVKKIKVKRLKLKDNQVKVKVKRLKLKDNQAPKEGRHC